MQIPAEESAPSAGIPALLELLPVGIFTTDEQLHILSINRAARELTGIDAEPVLGQRCDEVLRCSFCGPQCAACEASLLGRARTAFPTDIVRPDGSRCSVLLDAVPIGEGQVAVIVRNVTGGNRIRVRPEEKWSFHGLLCASGTMKEIVDRIRDVAPYNSTVLILGESGTGKELVARALHAESPRSSGPFVAVNCSAYSENLLESELFGHVRGSFTGADRDRRGRFESADGGTVFLDEIGDISSKIQVKLLRVLQEREIERVGENTTRPVDLRVIAATNRDLRRAVAEGRFREDLYYRLNVFTLQLPPLRQRVEDVTALAKYFLERIAEETGKQVRGFSEEVLRLFASHTWPGNVRELENVVESSLVRARGPIVQAVDLPAGFRGGGLPELEPEDRIRAALHRTAGCVTRAARLLGVHRTTLWRQMREQGLRREEFLLG